MYKSCSTEYSTKTRSLFFQMDTLYWCFCKYSLLFNVIPYTCSKKAETVAFLGVVTI